MIDSMMDQFFRGFHCFSSRRAEITRTRWRVSRRFGASEGSRIQEHQMHIVGERPEMGQRWASSIQVPCFNMFQHVSTSLPKQNGIKTLPIWRTEISDFCSAVESPFQGPYPFCCTVFNPAAHGIGDDEGLPLTTSTTSHLSLVSSGLNQALQRMLSIKCNLYTSYVGTLAEVKHGETW